MQGTSWSPTSYISCLSGILEPAEFVPEPNITIFGHELVKLLTATSTTHFILMWILKYKM